MTIQIPIHTAHSGPRATRPTPPSAHLPVFWISSALHLRHFLLYAAMSFTRGEKRDRATKGEQRSKSSLFLDQFPAVCMTSLGWWTAVVEETLPMAQSPLHARRLCNTSLPCSHSANINTNTPRNNHDCGEINIALQCWLKICCKTHLDEGFLQSLLIRLCEGVAYF
jgi:hypothetical protein